MKVKITPLTLEFNTPGGTSRGVLHTKPSYFIHLEQNGKTGLGEVSLIPNLSIDQDVDKNLDYWRKNFKSAEDLEEMNHVPAIKFGFEMALKNLEMERDYMYYDTAFSNGKSPIKINGLIWMGETEFMLQQIEKKLELGFDCLKMKVGAIDFQMSYPS